MSNIEVRKMIKIGDEIPEMETDAFADTELKKLNLKDYRGKWIILAFYPADFTFVCPTELEELAELHGEFKKEGAEIMSVSTDTNFTHLAWHDSSPAIGRVKYPMLADPSGKLCNYFGTYIEDEGVSLRATFIIDPEGKVKSIHIHDNSISRKAAEILRQLRAAKYVYENPGEVCPASWEPGSETLKPGADLVGKI